MLCELLEATTENPSSPDVATDDSAIDAGSHQEGDRRDELQDDSPARVSVVARNISKLRLESGLSYEKLATLMGVEKRTVMANAKGASVARPATLKLYAEVFTQRLDRYSATRDLNLTTPAGTLAAEGYAYRSELDAWWERDPARQEGSVPLLQTAKVGLRWATGAAGLVGEAVANYHVAFWGLYAHLSSIFSRLNSLAQSDWPTVMRSLNHATML